MRTIISVLLLFLCATLSMAEDPLTLCKAFSNSGNNFCILYQGALDFVDWSDISHPRKLSRLNLTKAGNHDNVEYSDVAFDGKTAYVTADGKGIVVVEASNMQKPVEKEFIPIDYTEYAGKTYNKQSISITSQVLNIISIFPDGIFSNKTSDPRIRRLILDPVKKESIWDHDITNGGYTEGNTFFRSYPRQWVFNPVFNVPHFALDIYSSAGVTHIDTESPAGSSLDFATRSNAHFIAVSQGNHLLYFDVDKLKLAYSKEFSFPIDVLSFNDRFTLIDSRTDYGYDNFYFIDNHHPDHVIPWRHENIQHKDGLECMLAGDLLLMQCQDYKGQDKFFFGYDVTNPNSIHRVDLPFGKDPQKVIWAIQSGDILFVGVTGSLLKIIDNHEAGHPKLRGTIKNIKFRPKEFIINNNRLYMLNRDESKKELYVWEPYSGIPTAIDISNLDKPEIKSVYNSK